MRKTIYIVDDEPSVLRVTKTVLENRGYQAVAFESPIELLKMLAQGMPSLILVDLAMPEMDGIEVIRRVRAMDKQIPIVVVTAESRVEVAIEAIKAGANEFLRKPVVRDELALTVQRLLEVNQLKETLESIRTDHAMGYGLESLIGSSPHMKAVRAFVQRVVEYPDATLLLRGESGTGKNHVARVIHFNSGRAESRFVDINCAAIPDQLLESELFGYEKGAFTDARAPKKGLFEAGDKGTVLLDEINAMSPALQAKLLSILEHHTFRRLGSTEDVEVDVRVITTTNIHLEEAVARKDFREDLYYRVNVVSIEIPPLRERADDIEPLALHFLSIFNRQFGKNVGGLTRGALGALKTYRWPGNIRELRNVLEHGMIFTDGPELDTPDLVLGKVLGTEKGTVERPRICSMQEMERDHIEHILLHTGGDTVKAAAILGISRKTLWEKRKKFGLG